jgi:hypothetical protein
MFVTKIYLREASERGAAPSRAASVLEKCTRKKKKERVQHGDSNNSNG